MAMKTLSKGSDQLDNGDRPYAPCCAGEIWNDTLKQCIACPLGHHGPFCRKKCEYPYFGKDCGDGECVCRKELCNYATGCQQTTEVITTKIDATSLLKTPSRGLAHSRTAGNITDTSSPFPGDLQQDGDGKSTADLLENPVFLSIIGVNCVFLIFIIVFVCNRLKKTCGAKTSKAVLQEQDIVVSECHNKDLYEKIYEEIPQDYNSLNQFDLQASFNRPYTSLRGAELPVNSNAGQHTDLSYDDVANVIERT